MVLPEGAFADGLRQAGFVVEVENGLTKIARSEDIFSWPRMVDRFPGVVQRAGLTHNMTTELVTMHFHVTGDADLVVRAIKGRS